MLDKSTKKNEGRVRKIAIRNAGMKQDDIVRVLNVSQSVESRPLKEHREREGGSITRGVQYVMKTAQYIPKFYLYTLHNYFYQKICFLAK